MGMVHWLVNHRWWLMKYERGLVIHHRRSVQDYRTLVIDDWWTVY